MIDEGSIKFDCRWRIDRPPDSPVVPKLIATRDLMFDLGLVGALPDGIGYGNVSVRVDRSRFIITGSGTGSVARLQPTHLTVVTSVDRASNRVDCLGPVIASSESMTHAALYHACHGIGAVIHIHSSGLWSRMLDAEPTTRPDVPYGTPAMAGEIERIVVEEEMGDSGIIVMGGHRDGILCFGRSLDEAEALLVERLGATGL